jgi:hypothetical protein
MTDEEKNRIALFRFGVISELVVGINEYSSKDSILKQKVKLIGLIWMEKMSRLVKKR